MRDYVPPVNSSEFLVSIWFATRNQVIRLCDTGSLKATIYLESGFLVTFFYVMKVRNLSETIQQC